MEKLKFKVMGLGEWSVVNSNPETKYHQIEGHESSGQLVKLWLPMAIVETIINREAQVKRKDSYRKTADYFKNERNELQRRNAEMAEAVSELRKKNIDLEESIGVLGFMSDDMSEEIQLKFHRHRVVTTIIGFIAVLEALAFAAFYFIMQK
jgi:hypothetical protein